ncbi:unnamed protein product [Acanthosepion pharaonis]|uniref:Uncharacterized protein n=1 Tax=Acanthosepion pharaonis TaxID=158019 RepID=A0A812EL39_ACAPH|nr:unnamed protein product [Sepia pharaonis]
MAAVRLSQSPQARHICLNGDIKSLAAVHGITCPSSSFWSFLAFNYNPSINLTIHDNLNVESMTCICQFCNLHKWAGDPACLCCSSIKVRLPLLHEPPTLLRGLIASSDPDSNHFLKTIRQYNNSFQMTSFGAQVVEKWVGCPLSKYRGRYTTALGLCCLRRPLHLNSFNCTLLQTTTYRPKPRLVFCRHQKKFLAGTSYYYFRPCFTRLTATFAVSNMLCKMLPFLPSAL